MATLIGRRAAGFGSVLFLVGSLTLVMGVPASAQQGNPPSVECASQDPLWNGEYWKIQISNGGLGTIETNVAGAITLLANGNWTNNNNSAVFRIVLKVGQGVGTDQIISGFWTTGQGGGVNLVTPGLSHVTFCFTDAAPPPSTTTTAQGTATTTQGTTTTTQATTTTAAVQVGGIQVTSTTAAVIGTQVSLPFTGVSTDGMTLASSAAVASGLLLLTLGRRREQVGPRKGWSSRI
jgi:hypothetical protein